MGKASSSKKVARAAKAAGRPGTGRNLAWPALIGVVVVLGIVLIVVSRGKTADSVAPKLGDHWHAAYGLYDCDHFLSPLSDQVPDESGLHTHDDGLMHMHPFGTRYTGAGANLGNWGETVGLDLTDDSVTASNGMDRTNGDSCGDAGEGTVQVKVWDSPDDPDGRLLEGDFADYAPQEFTLFVVAFVPEGTEIPKPPDEAIANLRAPSDVAGTPSTIPPISLDPGPTETTVPGSTETTVPGGTDPGSTETTVPGSTDPGSTETTDTTPSTEAPSSTVTTAQ